MLKTVPLTLTLILLAITPIAVLSVDNVAIHSNIAIVNSSSESITLDYDLNPNASNEGILCEEVFEDGQAFSHYYIKNEGFTYSYGRPQLPLISRVVVIPPHRGVELVVTIDDPRRERA